MSAAGREAAGNVARLFAVPRREAVSSAPGTPAGRDAAVPTRADPDHPDPYDDDCYIAAFPDVAAAVGEGRCLTGRRHYDEFGGGEGRLRKDAYQAALARAQSAAFPGFCIDLVVGTGAGTLLVEGWVDDEIAPLSCLRVLQHDRLLAQATELFRHRRLDVEAQAGIVDGRPVGFSALVRLGPEPDMHAPLAIGLELGSYRRLVEAQAAIVSVEALRRRALGRIRECRNRGMPAPAIAAGLGRQPRDLLGALGAALGARHAEAACCSRYGAGAGPAPALSVVVRIREAEAVFLQTALFAGPEARAGGLEMVFVSDDPAMQEQALREASASAMIYGVTVSVVSLPGRVGWAEAIDAGARRAAGARLLVVEPGVVPTAPDWFAALRDAWGDGPAAPPTLLGGYLRGGGGRIERRALEIEVEEATATAGDGGHRAVGLARLLPRAIHAAADAAAPGRIAAGNLLGIDRASFDGLGGFDTRFHSCRAATADLCLRALEAGVATGMRDLPLADLRTPDGRAAAGEDEASDLLDRALFTAAWATSAAGGRRAETGTRPAAAALPQRGRGRGEPARPEAARGGHAALPAPRALPAG